MRAAGRFLLMCIAMIGWAIPASAQSQRPEAVIKALYANYGLGSDPGAGKSGLTMALAGRIFDRGLLRLYKTAVDKGRVDDDFFVQGQDFDLAKPIEIEKASIAGAKAQVSATLTQHDADRAGKPRIRQDKFVFKLVRDNNGWRLDDARHGRLTFRKSLEP